MNRLTGLCFTSFAAVALSGAGQAQITEDAFVHQLRIATEEASRGKISAAEADARAAIALDPNRSSGWYELGSVLGQAADFPGAETALRRAIDLQPSLAKAHFSLALTLIANPQNKLDWPAAIDECREALKYQPDYPEALNLLGAGLANTGKTDEAIAMLQRAIQLSPSMPEAHFNLAMNLESKARLEEAAKEYRAAVAAKGSYPEAASGLGKLLFRMGKTSEAEQELDTALRLNPDLTDAHYTLARVLRSLHRDPEAKVEFAEAKDLIDRQPNGIHSSQLSNQGLALASKGDRAGAIASLHTAILLKPDYGVPHYNLGLVLADSGDTGGAILELTKAISLLPGQYMTWFDLGRVLQRAGDHRGALEALSWAAHMAPSDNRIAAELASLQAAGQTDDAGTHALRPAVQQPHAGAATDTAPDHLAFAMELNAGGDFQGAVGELLRALALQPAKIEARRSLAEAFVHLGETERAILEYHKILCSTPEDPDAHIAIGELLLARGDLGEASRHFRLALIYRPDSLPARAALDQAEKVAKRR